VYTQQFTGTALCTHNSLLVQLSVHTTALIYLLICNSTCNSTGTQANATLARKLFPYFHNCLSFRDSFTSSFSLF